MTNDLVSVDHIAMKVGDVTWYVAFFSDVFGMTQERANDPASPTQVWLSGRIQLVAESGPIPADGALHHLGFLVDDLESFADKMRKWGLEQIKPNWYALPNGVALELKPAG